MLFDLIEVSKRVVRDAGSILFCVCLCRSYTYVTLKDTEGSMVAISPTMTSNSATYVYIQFEYSQRLSKW